MAERRPCVLILEHDIGLADLMRVVLEDDGFDAEWLLIDPGVEADLVLSNVRRQQPDLLVVDLDPQEIDRGLELLDALRADPVAEQIPILVTSAGALEEAVRASYNVKAMLAKPFELGELLAAVGEAIGRPPLQAELDSARPAPEGLLARAETVLAEHSREALFRWVQALQRQPPWQGRRDLRLADLLDNVPVLVEAVDAALEAGGVEPLLAARPEIADRIGQHARNRRRQGFHLGAIVREYGLLGDELWGTIWRYVPGPLQPADVYALQRVIDGTLVRIVELTVRGYGEDQSTAAA